MKRERRIELYVNEVPTSRNSQSRIMNVRDFEIQESRLFVGVCVGRSRHITARLWAKSQFVNLNTPTGS